MTYAEAVARLLGAARAASRRAPPGPRAHRDDARRRSATPSARTASSRSAAPTARAPSRRCSRRSSPPPASAPASTPRRTSLVPRAHPRRRPRRSPGPTSWTASRPSARWSPGSTPSMFEAATALALDHFAREAVDVAVLEVGLGGRLDATTVGRPEVEVLGPIDSTTRPCSAPRSRRSPREKAAIIRSGVALSARQDPAAEAVLARRAPRPACRSSFEGRDLRAAARGTRWTAQRLDLAGPGWRIGRRGLRAARASTSRPTPCSPRRRRARSASARARSAAGLAAARLARALPVIARAREPARRPRRRPQPGGRARARRVARRLLPGPARRPSCSAIFADKDARGHPRRARARWPRASS